MHLIESFKKKIELGYPERPLHSANHIGDDYVLNWNSSSLRRIKVIGLLKVGQYVIVNCYFMNI